MTDRAPAPGRPSILRVLIADDHQIFRESLAVLLDMHHDVSIVGQAANGRQAVELAVRDQPDIVLLDLEMPGQSVFTTLAELRSKVPAARVVILTMHERASLARQLLLAGATSYLIKTIGHHELVAAMKTALGEGQDVVTMNVTRSSLATAMADGRGGVLSPRERQILTLAGKALTNAQIGTELQISEGTVKRHLANVNVKLGASSRLDAVRRATQEGLIRSSFI